MPLPARAQKYRPVAEHVGALVGIDPMLLLAVMDRESRCGEALKPPGPAGTGDGGHGRGLMQVDDRSHGPFVQACDDRGVYLWKIAEFNMLYAARLLRANLNALSGDVAGALCAYNAGLGNAKKMLAAIPADADLPVRVKALDTCTANHNYVADVMSRRTQFCL